MRTCRELVQENVCRKKEQYSTSRLLQDNYNSIAISGIVMIEATPCVPFQKEQFIGVSEKYKNKKGFHVH